MGTFRPQATGGRFVQRRRRFKTACNQKQERGGEMICAADREERGGQQGKQEDPRGCRRGALDRLEVAM